MRKINILEKLRKARRGKKILWLLGLVPIVFGLIFPITLQAAFSGIGETMNSIIFPNSFIKKDFNTTKPWIEYSFFMRNYHKYNLERFKVDIIINFFYFEKNNTREQRDQIFTQTLTYHDISPQDYIVPNINATSENFNLVLLESCLKNGNFSKSYSYLMDIKFIGSYIANLVSFSENVKKLNISTYEFPF